MNQKQIAKILGIQEPYMSLIIAGRRRPYHICIKLADLTGTDVRLWMDGTPDEKRAALETIKEVKK